MDNVDDRVCKRTASTADDTPAKKRAKKSLVQLNNPCEINDNRIPEYVSSELKDQVPEIMEDLGVSPVLAKAVKSYIPLADIEIAVVHIITHILLPPLRYAVTKKFPNIARIYYESYDDVFENGDVEDDSNCIIDTNKSDNIISRRLLMLECKSSDIEESSKDLVDALDVIRSDLIASIVRKIQDPGLMRVTLPQRKMLILCLRIYALVISCIKPALSTYLVEDEDFITNSFKSMIGS
nr:MAG: wsv310-like protein [Penaeus semisulcatus pemonivirus]